MGIVLFSRRGAPHAVLALLLVLGAGACRDHATLPEPRRTWADSAFGGDAVEWAVDDPAGGGRMIPELDETNVYFESEGGELVALDRATGEREWSGSIIAAQNAAVAGDLIGALWGSLAVFHRVTGAPRYNFTYPGTSLSGNVASSPGRFYLVTHSGRAVAIDAVDGSIEWDTNLAGGDRTTGFGVTHAGDAVFVTLKHFSSSVPMRDSGIVAALDAATGSIRWRVVLHPDSVNESAIVRPAVISGSNVIIKTQGHDVIAFDLTTGERRWKFDARYGLENLGSDGLSACDGRIIAATGDLGVVALDGGTGAVRWKVPNVDQGSLFSLRCSHGTVTVLGSMPVLDAATGLTLVEYPIDQRLGFASDFWIAAAVRDAEFLYVATSRGYAKIKAP